MINIYFDLLFSKRKKYLHLPKSSHNYSFGNKTKTTAENVGGSVKKQNFKGVLCVVFF